MGKAPRQLPINSRSTTASCGQCSALMLPNASVCKRCGGLAADYDRRIDYDRRADFELTAVQPAAPVLLEDALPAYAGPNPERLSTILGCWPFGAADASDGPTITLPAESTGPTPHLEPATYPNDVPTQRAEAESAPAVDPSPLLAASGL